MANEVVGLMTLDEIKSEIQLASDDENSVKPHLQYAAQDDDHVLFLLSGLSV
jgi:hypothetical protein